MCLFNQKFFNKVNCANMYFDIEMFCHYELSYICTSNLYTIWVFCKFNSKQFIINSLSKYNPKFRV